MAQHLVHEDVEMVDLLGELDRACAEPPPARAGWPPRPKNQSDPPRGTSVQHER
jgi:hypothetical protein